MIQFLMILFKENNASKTNEMMMIQISSENTPMNDTSFVKNTLKLLTKQIQIPIRQHTGFFLKCVYGQGTTKIFKIFRNFKVGSMSL